MLVQEPEGATNGVVRLEYLDESTSEPTRFVLIAHVQGRLPAAGLCRGKSSRHPALSRQATEASPTSEELVDEAGYEESDFFRHGNRA